MFIRKEISCTSCIDIFCLVKVYISLFCNDCCVYFVYDRSLSILPKLPQLSKQSCHSYVIHLHDEVFFKKLDLEVSGTQIYFCEIVLEGKTLFYKPKKMVVTKSVECTPSLTPKVLNQFFDCKGLF